MHDAFTVDDLADDAQRLALAHWLAVRNKAADIPLSAFAFTGHPWNKCQRFAVLDLSLGGVRRARVIAASEHMAQAIGIDPTGHMLSDVLSADYFADVIPALALCAGLFRPLITQDEIVFSDGAKQLICRLLLPVGRQPDSGGNGHQAGYLIMAISELDKQSQPASKPPKTMQRVRSHAVSVFKDGIDRS